jgi:hypothetical protein
MSNAALPPVKSLTNSLREKDWFIIYSDLKLNRN